MGTGSRARVAEPELDCRDPPDRAAPVGTGAEPVRITPTAAAHFPGIGPTVFLVEAAPEGPRSRRRYSADTIRAIEAAHAQRPDAHDRHGSRHPGPGRGPHHLAAQFGLAILRHGGNAIEGDGFRIVHAPDAEPIAIDACGAAATRATPQWYRSRGFDAIPARGPLAANTVAGAVSGWEAALAIGRRWGGTCPLDRLLDDAIRYAEHGVPVTASQHATTRDKRAELEAVPGFAEQFLPGGVVPAVGDRFVNERLGRTFRRLAQDGLDSFHRGPLADTVAADLARIGSPLTGDDLARHRAQVKRPLALRPGTAYNFPPPTQQWHSVSGSNASSRPCGAVRVHQESTGCAAYHQAGSPVPGLTEPDYPSSQIQLEQPLRHRRRPRRHMDQSRDHVGQVEATIEPIRELRQVTLCILGTSRMGGAAQGILDVAGNRVHPPEFGGLDAGASPADHAPVMLAARGGHALKQANPSQSTRVPASRCCCAQATSPASACAACAMRRCRRCPDGGAASSPSLLSCPVS